MIWEYVGYLASAFLVASLMMEDVTKLRYFNLAGCVCFTLYGLAINAWPVAFSNGILTAVNIYHLVKLVKKAKHKSGLN